MQFIDNREILFIVNPHSGRNKALKIVKKISALNLGIACIITKNLLELDNIFKENIDKYKAFIIVGGDGTVNETLKYLFEKEDKFLGVLPAGSGNGFSRELGFRKSLNSLVKDINKGESMNLDLLSVNNNKCINVAGIGFDSFVAHCFEKSKNRGLKTYILSTLKSIFIFKPFHASLLIDNKKIEGKFQMITFANTRQFGNNAIIAPQAKPNDGIFEVVLIKPFPFYLYPFFVVKLFSGQLKDSKYITYLKVLKMLEIKSNFKKYHIDGEPRSFEDKLCIKMLKSKIRIIKTAHNRWTVS
ncbi:MAG: YegS/Rv2252/BmrU family lipid kinase [Bacteroidales bacterium]|jgi:diacylglycerol kinase (ATP)|nr:YegS/Rv2252/BmrU family lipid kinase [Bacteroidales bacterium]